MNVRSRPVSSRRSLTRWLPPVALAGVVLAAVWPFFGGRYVFFLDQVVGPAWRPFATRLFETHGAAYGGSLPLYGVVGAIRAAVGSALAQKAFLVGVLAVVAAAGYRFLPGPRWARLYGAVVLLVNPFVYERVLAGQFLVVWGVGMLPVAVYAVEAYLEEGSTRGLVGAVAGVTLLGFSAHALYASSVLFAVLTVTKSSAQGRRVLGRAARICLLALPINAYWIGPGLLAGGPLMGVSAGDLARFAPRIDAVSALFTTAAMGGFWREGVRSVDLLSATWVLYAGMLGLAVYGFLATYDDERRGPLVRALALTGVIAVLLGAGASGPAAPAFRWLFETVPLFEGMRDANKFVALLVFAYAYLGALGVAELRTRIRALRPRARSAVPVLVLAVCLPLGYTHPMVTGYGGQVHATDYPQEWADTASYVETRAGGHSVLVLPWHRYMDYSWLGEGDLRVSTPARQYFSIPVIQAGSADASVSGTVRSAFDAPSTGEPAPSTDIASTLAALDVTYVLLDRVADWRRYADLLGEASELRLVHENDAFLVFRSERASDGATADPESAVDGSPTDAVDEAFYHVTLPSYAVSAVAALATCYGTLRSRCRRVATTGRAARSESGRKQHE